MCQGGGVNGWVYSSIRKKKTWRDSLLVWGYIKKGFVQ